MEDWSLGVGIREESGQKEKRKRKDGSEIV
jgi:hypothetical protein